MNYFQTMPTTTSAYCIDSNGNEYFGEVARGSNSSRPRWQIVQKKNTGTSQPAWVTLYPVGADGTGSIWTEWNV